MGSIPVAYAAIGTQLWVGDGGTLELFFQVAHIQDVSGPKMKRDTIDVTTHDSQVNAGGYKEFIGSLKDGQEVTFPLVFDPNSANHNETATVVGTTAGGLKYLFETNVKRNMRIQLPTSPTTRLRFVGQVTEFDTDLKVAGAVMANCTIKVSGKPTLEVGTGSGA